MRVKPIRQGQIVMFALAVLCLLSMPVQADIFKGYIPCAENGTCGNQAGETPDEEVGQIGSEIPDNHGGDGEPDLVVDEEILEENSSLCEAPTESSDSVFVEVPGIDNSVKDCKRFGCRDGDFGYQHDNDDISEEDKICKSCDKGELKNDDKACDDGLFCTSSTGIEPGPDHCVDGKCKGLEIKDIEGVWSQAGSFDFGEAEKFVQKVRNIGKVIDSLKGHIGQGSTGTGVGGESTGSWRPTLEYSIRDITQCCEKLDKITIGTQHKGTISASPLKRTWQSPGFPIPVLPAVKVGIDIEASAGLSGSISGVVSECDDDNCNKPDVELSIEATVGGGPYAAVFHPKLLKISGIVAGKASATVSFLCLRAPTKPPQLCFNDVTLTGRATLLGGLNYDIGRTFKVNACL